MKAIIRTIKVDINKNQYLSADISKLDDHCFIDITRYEVGNKNGLSRRTKVCNNMTEAFQFLNSLIQEYREKIGKKEYNKIPIKRNKTEN